MNPLRWALLALCVAALVAAALSARGCHAPRPDGVPADTPSPAEARAVDQSASAEADARAYLDQADADAEHIARLTDSLRTVEGQTAGLREVLAATRRRTDIVITAPTRTIRDTVRIEAPDGNLPEQLAELVVTERLAADAVLAQCETRAALADSIAEAQQSRAVWAYAAADSALAALSYTRLAYREADVRAARSYADARAYRSQRNAAWLLTGAVAAACTVAGFAR